MKLVNKRKKRKQRKLRSKPVRGNLTRPRLVLSKSNRYLTAQVIDDEKGQTLIYLCTANLNEEKTKSSYCCKNKKWAAILGQALINRMKEEGIEKIVFDRNGRPYHGKIEIFCNTIRKGGISF
jgi:large subunit ribosomal protein L18